jgi:Flp pilus assembly secretin CpaC
MATGDITPVQFVTTADAKEGGVGKPASLPGSVIQTAASNPTVLQLPSMPVPGEVPNAPVGPAPLSPPAPAILPPAAVAAPGESAASKRIDDSTGATAVGAQPSPPDAMQTLPPSSSLALPAPGSGPQDVKKPMPPNPVLESPTPNKLPIGMPPQNPMASPVVPPLPDVPQPTQQELETIRDYIEGIVDPNCILDLVQGRARLVKLKTPARSVHVSGTEIINCTPVNSREIVVQARAVGTALLHLTFGDDDKATVTVLHYMVRVSPALTAREPYEAIFRALEAEIAAMFPESKVQLKLVGDAVLVSGQVCDARDATTILQLVVANTPWAGRNAAAGPDDPLAVAASGSPHVINRLQIVRAAQHQVTLKVAAVELSRSAAWSLFGKGLDAHGRSASPDANHSAGAIVPVLYEVSGGKVSAAWGAAALSSVKQANGADGRPMPEPRQIMLHDQPATVVASGQCLVTASPNKAPTEQRSVTFGLHGIDMSFVPVCVEGEPLRLTVAAGAGRQGIGRPFSYTVALREGQALALTGLFPPLVQERDWQQTAGRWSFFNRFATVEQPAAQERETVILILPEAVGAH